MKNYNIIYKANVIITSNIPGMPEREEVLGLFSQRRFVDLALKDVQDRQIKDQLYPFVDLKSIEEIKYNKSKHKRIDEIRL